MPHARLTRPPASPRLRLLATVAAAGAVLVVGVGPTATPGAQAAPAAAPTVRHHTSAPAHARMAARVLVLVNRARRTGRSCGGVHYAAVAPLHRDGRLAHAARHFAVRMGEGGFFDHTAPDGSDPGDRISAAGYRWSTYGENIAAGYPTPASVVAGWLESPGHCANIMTAFHDGGVGYARVPGSPYGTYWVTDFASH